MIVREIKIIGGGNGTLFAVACVVIAEPQVV
jgi:hypothetical protein